MKHIDKATSWYFSRQALPYWTILFMDIILLFIANLIGLIIVCGTGYTLHNIGQLMGTFAFYALFYIIGFRIFHTYSGVLRFSSFIDLQHVGYAMILGLGCTLWFRCTIDPYWLMHVRIIALILATFIATMLMWCMRVVVKRLYDGLIRYNSHTKCFIYGVKEGGIALAKSINTQELSPYIITGFVSDESDMIDKVLFGKKVYPNDQHLINEMRKHGASVLIVSPLKIEELRSNNDMVSNLIEADIRILIVQSAQEWDGKSDLSYTQLKEVNVEDLLPRDKIEIDMNRIGEMLRGHTILITGAAGSIGSEMVRQISPFQPKELILVDQAETPLHDIRLMMARQWGNISAHTIIADIAHENRMDEIFRLYRPEYVFHAAAYKHVPMMEDNPAESIENNVNGTKIVADMAVKYGTKKFVMVSTDKAVNPTNVMGCSKRICEIYVQSLDKAIKEGKIKGVTQFVTTRFGNVLGSNGSVIPLFERQIKAGGPVTVTHPDIIRYFMLIPEACRLVLEAGTMGNGGEIFVFDMGKPVRIADLAKRMIKLSGAKDIEIKFTGLRDGEKLYEEVLNDKEVTLPTFHEKIKIAQVREYDYSTVDQIISSLISIAISADDMTIVGEMKALVPEFKSQHSKYEVLDK